MYVECIISHDCVARFESELNDQGISFDFVELNERGNSVYQVLADSKEDMLFVWELVNGK